MDNYILIGKIINTFGIRGELKVVSDFEYISRVFKKDFSIYIGINKNEEIINNVRIHKNNYLVLLDGYSNINEVLKYKGNNIYILRNDLKLKDNEYLLSDLIGFKVYDNNNLIGNVIDYEKTVNSILLKVKGDKTFYLPLISPYIKEINLQNQEIITNEGSELVI